MAWSQDSLSASSGSTLFMAVSPFQQAPDVAHENGLVRLLRQEPHVLQLRARVPQGELGAENELFRPKLLQRVRQGQVVAQRRLQIEVRQFLCSRDRRG